MFKCIRAIEFKFFRMLQWILKNSLHFNYYEIKIKTTLILLSSELFFSVLSQAWNISLIICVWHQSCLQSNQIFIYVKIEMKIQFPQTAATTAANSLCSIPTMLFLACQYLWAEQFWTWCHSLDRNMQTLKHPPKCTEPKQLPM